MKRTAAILALALLTGCEHFVDLTPASFLPGTAAPAQFQRDNAACQSNADVARRRAGGNGDPHGIYNATYRACMHAAGYHPRSPEGFNGW